MEGGCSTYVILQYVILTYITWSSCDLELLAVHTSDRNQHGPEVGSS